MVHEYRSAVPHRHQRTAAPLPTRTRGTLGAGADQLRLVQPGWPLADQRHRDRAVFDSRAWFSDRVVNRGPTPLAWQQFSAADPDPVVFRFTLNGDHVRLHADLTRWGATWDADSFGYDATTEQLQFHVPGAGAGAPPALMLTSFGPGAGFL